MLPRPSVIADADRGENSSANRMLLLDAEVIQAVFAVGTASLTFRAARFNACAELEQPAQIIGIAPSLADQSTGDVVNEHRGEHLLATMAWYAQETVLIDGIRGADGHLVDGGDDILNGPLLFDTPEHGEQLTDTRLTGRQPWWTTVHSPGRTDHGDEAVDVVFTDERKEAPADFFVDVIWSPDERHSLRIVRHCRGRQGRTAPSAGRRGSSPDGATFASAGAAHRDPP